MRLIIVNLKTEFDIHCHVLDEGSRSVNVQVGTWRIEPTCFVADNINLFRNH